MARRSIRGGALLRVGTGKPSASDRLSEGGRGRPASRWWWIVAAFAIAGWGNMASDRCVPDWSWHDKGLFLMCVSRETCCKETINYERSRWLSPLTMAWGAMPRLASARANGDMLCAQVCHHTGIMDVFCEHRAREGMAAAGDPARGAAGPPACRPSGLAGSGGIQEAEGDFAAGAPGRAQAKLRCGGRRKGGRSTGLPVAAAMAASMPRKMRPCTGSRAYQ